VAHRRVAALARELDAPEQQRFEMGPSRHPPSAPRLDFSRGHVLGAQGAANKGIPWMPTAGDDDGEEQKNVARRNVLRHELQSAEQALEWVPALANMGRARSMDIDYSRVNAFKKEDGEAFEFLSGAIRNTSIPGGDKFHGRRNVLSREASSLQSLDMPRANGHAGAVPSYGRDGRLAREHGGVFRGAGKSMLKS